MSEAAVSNFKVSEGETQFKPYNIETFDKIIITKLILLKLQIDLLIFMPILKKCTAKKYEMTKISFQRNYKKKTIPQ